MAQTLLMQKTNERKKGDKEKKKLVVDNHQCDDVHSDYNLPLTKA
jgi:hypothetical protein